MKLKTTLIAALTILTQLCSGAEFRTSGSADVDRARAEVKTAPIPAENDRVGWSSDGNLADPDDWAATAMALAIFAKQGWQDKLVHFDYNNRLDRSLEWKEAENYESTIGGARRFQFNKAVFFDDQRALEAAIEHAKQEINNSHEGSKFWYVMAGPFEVAYQALLRANPEKRQYCILVSHSPVNEQPAKWKLANGSPSHGKDDCVALGANYFFTTPQYMEKFGGRKFLRWDLVEWMKNSPSEEYQWVHSRFLATAEQKDGGLDASDGGMAFALATGDLDGNFSPKLKDFLGTGWKKTQSPAVRKRLSFNKDWDLLVVQYDGRSDADDIHSMAALGCMLEHPDFKDVQVYGVMNAYGRQKSPLIWDSTSLMEMIFGPEGADTWTNADKLKAEGGNGTGDWALSVRRVIDKVKPVLLSGGRIWVQEAGQSDITADWVRALCDDPDLAGVDIKRKVFVVQHSLWNQKQTTKAALEYVRAATTYFKIDDGNYDQNDSKTANDKYANNKTADYETDDADVAAHAILREQAKSDSNPNPVARRYWTEADRLIGDWGTDYSSIDEGGLDFSDCVECWWIFEVGSEVDTIPEFWARFVVKAEVNYVKKQADK